MKFKKLVSLLILPLCFATAVYASGPGFEFDDVPEGVWYYDAVYDLLNRGLLNTDDAYFHPGDYLNRAEMAVIGDRMMDYVEHPMGDEWTEFTNDTYTIWYPSSKYTLEYLNDDLCSTGLDVGVDYIWAVNCNDDIGVSIEDRIDDMGGVATVEEFMMGDARVTRAVVVKGEMIDIDWYREMIFIEKPDTDFYIYISNGAIKNSDFEYFWRSFEFN